MMGLRRATRSAAGRHRSLRPSTRIPCRVILEPQLSTRGATPGQIDQIVTTFWDGVDTTTKVLQQRAPLAAGAIVNCGLPAMAPPGGGPVVQLGTDTPMTQEMPGTGNPNAVQAEPYTFGPDDPPAPISDNLTRVLQMAMEQGQMTKDGYSPPVVVHAGVDTWLVADNINSMNSGDKVALAFNQLYSSGKLGDEFKEALEALLSPEALVFFGAMVGIQLLPGVNFAVDTAAFLILLVCLGENIDDLLDGLSEAGSAINQQHLDRAETKLAKAFAAIGTVAVIALVGKIAGKVGTKVKAHLAGDDVPSGAPTTSSTARNPELNKGGVRPALGATDEPAPVGPDAAPQPSGPPTAVDGQVPSSIPSDDELPPRPTPFKPRSEATGPDIVTRAEDPADYFQRTYPPDVAGPVTEAWQMADNLLDGQVDGVAGSYAKGVRGPASGRPPPPRTQRS